MSVLLVTGTALKLVGFETVWKATLATRPVGEPLSARVVARRVRRWARWVPNSRLCLPQAFATAVLFRRHGLDGKLVVGVRHHPFEAHAWVVHGGQVVIGAEEQPLYSPIWTGVL